MSAILVGLLMSGLLAMLLAASAIIFLITRLVLKEDHQVVQLENEADEGPWA
jgi:hypothetical protein